MPSRNLSSHSQMNKTHVPTTKPYPHVILRAFSLLLCTLSLSVVLLGCGATAKQVSVEFESGASPVEGNVSPITATQGDEIELPENGYTRDGYHFAGWERDPNDESASEIAQPGNTITLGDENITYTAVWDVEVSFDGNGADSGSMDPVYVNPSGSGDLSLPKCKFKRKGCMFAGWSTDPNDDSNVISTDASNLGLEKSTTLYAIWARGALLVDVPIDNPGEDAEGVESWSSEYGNAALRLANKSDKDIVFAAFMEFLDSKDKDVWRRVVFSFWRLAPGESTLVLPDASRATEDTEKLHWYVMTKEDPNKTDRVADPKQSIGEAVKVDEKDVSNKAITVNVKNAHTDQLASENVSLVATTKDGISFVATKDINKDIAPDQSEGVTFEAKEVLGDIKGVKISDLERSYYSDAGGTVDVGAPLFWIGDDTVDSMWDALLYVPLLPEDFM